MSTFADFTDFQIVFTSENINNYDLRPKLSYSYFTDFQPVFIAGTLYTMTNIPQYRNCFLMKQVGGLWVSDCELNINPNNDLEIQTLLDTHSGFVGRKTFNAQQLINLAAASSGEIVLVFLESIDNGVSVFDMNTNLAKIETNTGKTIWSCEIIN